MFVPEWLPTTAQAGKAGTVAAKSTVNASGHARRHRRQHFRRSAHAGLTKRRRHKGMIRITSVFPEKSLPFCPAAYSIRGWGKKAFSARVPAKTSDVAHQEYGMRLHPHPANGSDGSDKEGRKLRQCRGYRWGCLSRRRRRLIRERMGSDRGLELRVEFGVGEISLRYRRSAAVA